METEILNFCQPTGFPTLIHIDDEAVFQSIETNNVTKDLTDQIECLIRDQSDSTYKMSSALSDSISGKQTFKYKIFIRIHNVLF